MQYCKCSICLITGDTVHLRPKQVKVYSHESRQVRGPQKGAYVRYGSPSSSILNRIVHYKPTIWGYPHLWKPTYCSFSRDVGEPSRFAGLADGEVECWKFVKRLVLLGRFKYSLVIQNSYGRLPIYLVRMVMFIYIP